jgi:transcription elongation factor GreA
MWTVSVTRFGPGNNVQPKERPTVTQPTPDAVWLTQEAHDRLQAELTHLITSVRPELSKRIGEARDEGDLRENGGYHAAKEEQGRVEARIRQLQEMMRKVEVGEAPATADVVRPGTKVTIRFVGDDDTETFLLGSRELLALDTSVDIEVYSPQSPLGAAINGKRAGEKATYAAPNGRDVSVEVVQVEPFGG